MAERSLAERVGDELDRCRERGLEELDLSGSRQRPKETPELDHLAQQYSDVKGLALYGHIAQIRRLLRDSLPAYADHGNDYESQVISRVFFDPDPEPDKRKRPGELLEAARKAHGLDAGRFRNYLDGLFAAFADFLIAFVADAISDAEHTAPTGEPEPTPERTDTVRARYLLVRIAGAIAALVVIGGVLTAVVLTHTNGGQAGQPTPSPVGSPHPSSPPHAAGKTYTEQGDNKNGSITFTDPHHPTVTGAKIDYMQRVQVSCKVYAVPPDMTSAYPDGYWYRIASSPWNNSYYAIANTFLNGDSINGPTVHNTDYSVPDCPN